MRKQVGLLLSFLFVVALPLSLPAQEDQYLQIYSMIQEGNSLLEQNRSEQALAKFIEARTALQRFQRGYAEWNPDVVKFRMEFLGGKIADLSSKVQQPAQPAPAPQVEKPEKPFETTIRMLGRQVQALQSDKTLLEAKLKEALAAQPAAVDPAQLKGAEEQIVALRKENELLKESLSGQKSAPIKFDTNAVAKLQRSLDEANRQLTTERETTARLARDYDALQKQTATTPQIDSEPSSKRERELVRKIEKERDEYRKQLESANKELNKRKSKATAARLEQLEQAAATLQARLSVLEAEKIPFSAEEMAMIRRPDTKLATATSVPATAAVASPDIARPASTLAPGTATLIAEARRHFSARELDQAEDKFQQAVKQAGAHPQALADLATVQMERGRLDDASKTIREALSIAADDPYVLSVSGQVSFRQGRVDDAINALGRAATLDPQSAEVQNWLGVALGQKGMRAPAETALRKAIQLQPGYGQAHNNLAVIYAGQNPPLFGLAKWHYQKALATGMAKNPELEKMLEASNAPSVNQ